VYYISNQIKTNINANMQMYFNSIQTINERLHKLEKILNDKLLKLDVLDVINKKCENFEKQFME